MQAEKGSERKHSSLSRQSCKRMQHAANVGLQQQNKKFWKINNLRK